MNGPSPDGLALWACRLVDAGHLSPGARLLDVGGGSGVLAAAIHAARGVDVTVADPAASSSPQPGVTFVRGRAEALPFDAGRFDAVLFSHALHHLPDREAALREAGRVAAPGARLLLRTASHADLRALPHASWMPALLSGILSLTPDVPEILDLLERTGWHEAEARSFSTPQEGRVEEYADSVAMCAWREWAMRPGGGPDPRPAARAWALERFSGPPPVAETLIVARRRSAG